MKLSFNRTVDARWEERKMGRFVKTALIWIAVAFLIYYIYTRPEAAAQFVRTILGSFDRLIRFFHAIIG